MIEIKAWYGDWHEVTPEKALEFAKKLMKGMTARTKDQIKIINEHHLRGATVEELTQDNI